MKITNQQLTQIILEETKKVLEEQSIGAELDSIIKQLSALKGKAGGAPVVAGGEAEAVAVSAKQKQAETLAQKAKELFKGGKYKKAGKLFGDINELMGGKFPSMTYNAARAYEMAGDLETAVIIFKKYLTLPNISPEGKKSAQEKIDALSATELVD